MIKILETDSPSMVNIIKGNWRIPWEMAKTVEEIQEHINK